MSRLKTAGEQKARVLFLQERKANISQYQRTASLMISLTECSAYLVCGFDSANMLMCQAHIYEFWRMGWPHSLTSVCPPRKLPLCYSWTTSICPENMLCPHLLLNLYTNCHCEWKSSRPLSRLQKLVGLWKFSHIVTLEMESFGPWMR